MTAPVRTSTLAATMGSRSRAALMPVLVTLAFLAAGVLAAPGAFAQLKKGRVFKAERKTCVECHKKEARDYRSRSSRHTPVQEERCETCHLKHGVVGLLRLTEEDPDLCLICHGPEERRPEGRGRRISQALKAEKRVDFTHPPREGLKCGACHDPHGSENPRLLKEEGPAACLTCHEAAAFRGTSAHPPETVDCLTCHAPHGSASPGSLKTRADTLCMACHDGGTPAEREGHGGETPAGSACLSCHAPHASESDGLLRRNVHAAMAEGGASCGTCHDVGADPQSPFALTASAGELCLGCHEDPREVPAGERGGSFRVHVPLAGAECITCHTPHASDEDALLQQPQITLCGTCHEESEKTTTALSAHAPATEMCTACHLPHAGGTTLLVATAPALCETCHDGVKEQIGRSHAHPPAAEGDCLTCHDPHGSAHKGVLKDAPGALCTACHEQIEMALSARFPHAALSTGGCVSCHEPHGSDEEGLIVGDLSAACLACHTKTAGEFEEAARHAPFTAGECLVCHQPHASSREDLLASEPRLLCESCHDDVAGGVTAASRHLPVVRGKCLSCHGPHGGHEPSLLRRENPKTLCLSCHTEESQMLARADVGQHPPFKEGSCLACHTSHVSDHPGLLAQAPSVLCTTCHDASAPSMTRAHKGLLTPGSDCTGCHEPHASEGEGLLLAFQHAPFGDGKCGDCHRGEAP